MFGISKDKKYKKQFENITSSMISLAFENVNNDKVNVAAIFIYCSYEEEFPYYDCFYCINGSMLERHKVNDTGQKYNLSDEMQLKFIKLANQDLKKLINVFEEYGKDVPTEIKMEYYPKTGKFDCNLGYDLHYTNLSNGTPDDVAESWFEELKLKIESDKTT